MRDRAEPSEQILVAALHFGWLSSSWSFYLLSLGAMLTLAALDFTGSIFAKEWTLRHHSSLFLAGLATFGVLFCVYAITLKYAELSVVTFGWIVFLQVGLLLVDRLRYGVTLPTGKWVAVALILALQAYLVLAPNGEAADDALITVPRVPASELPSH
jgi:hypothetical protein